MSTRPIARIVLHLDMDAFYAAVEVRENPSLAGKPLIIGHRGRRGVVSTCSYEARTFGVHSAMPSAIAERRCPGAIWLAGRMRLYQQVSREIRRILAHYSPSIEPLSIDEAFIDLTGIDLDFEAASLKARTIKGHIRREQGLTSSVGVAPNKFLAKVASDLDKPDGITLLCPANLADRFHPLGVERLWGVGPRTAEKLRGAGLSTVGSLLHVREDDLAALVGAGGAAHLQALARGLDDRPVLTRRQARSVSEERTYGEDLVRPADIDRAMLARSEGVARQLRREGLTGRTVHLKVRRPDFTTWTRALTLPQPTDLAEPIVAAAREMFRDRIRLEGHGVRLLGVGVSGLEPRGRGQTNLFTDADEDRARRLTRAADAVRDRMGEGAVTRARLLDRGKSPRETSSLPSVD